MKKTVLAILLGTLALTACTTAQKTAPENTTPSPSAASASGGMLNAEPPAQNAQDPQ